MVRAYSEVGDHVDGTPDGFQMLLPREPRGSKDGWTGESCFCCGCTGKDTKEAAEEEGRGSAVEPGTRYPLPQMEDTSGGGVQLTSCVLNGDSGPVPAPDQFAGIWLNKASTASASETAGCAGAMEVGYTDHPSLSRGDLPTSQISAIVLLLVTAPPFMLLASRKFTQLLEGHVLFPWNCSSAEREEELNRLSGLSQHLSVLFQKLEAPPV